MTEKQFVAILKKGFMGPENVGSEIVANNLLRNNEAMWSFSESRLHVSPAAKILLLDPETFEAALDGLAISWEPAD